MSNAEIIKFLLYSIVLRNESSFQLSRGPTAFFLGCIRELHIFKKQTHIVSSTALFSVNPASNKFAIENKERRFYLSAKKLGKHLQVRRSNYFWAPLSFQMFTVPSFEIKLHLVGTAILRGFQTPRELVNPLSKAVPVKCHGSGAYGNFNCLQDRANFRKSRVWQIALIFNIVLFIMKIPLSVKKYRFTEMIYMLIINSICFLFMVPFHRPFRQLS